MAHRMVRTEHCGAKNGGGHWGRRVEAKQGSSRRRREADNEIVFDEYDLEGMSVLPDDVCYEPPTA